MFLRKRSGCIVHLNKICYYNHQLNIIITKLRIATVNLNDSEIAALVSGNGSVADLKANGSL
jgi:hypothetical protein